MGTMTTQRQRDIRSNVSIVMNKNSINCKSHKVGNKWVSNDTDKVYRPLRIQTISASRLKDATYQRKINMAEVKKIMEDFRMELVNPIKVGLRKDGSYHIIDGQHTYIAITTLFGDDVDITCVILDYSSEDWKHLSDEQIEARVFAHQHDNTRKLSVNEKFNASVIGGEQNAANILKICDNNGFTLNYKNGQSASIDTFVCTNTLINIYNEDNGILLDNTLSVLRSAYHGCVESLESNFVKYIARFINKYSDEPNYTATKFITALSRNIKSPKQFVDEAKETADISKAKFGKKRTNEYCAEIALLEAYNKSKQEQYRILLK